MKTEETVITQLAHANPIPDPDTFDVVDVGAADYLTTLEQWSSERTQLDTENNTQTEKAKEVRTVRPWLIAAAVIIVAGVALTLTSQGDEAPVAGQPGPEVVLADYQDALNSGNPGAVLAFYAEDAVVKNHPLDINGTADGSTIIALETNIYIALGSTGRVEFSDIEVSGSTVTFNYVFLNTEFNHKFLQADRECFGGAGSRITVEDGKIILYAWGPTDQSQCD